LKLSTTHSFKGIEAAFVFYIASNEDSEEITYTSITRSKKDLVVFMEKTHSNYDFFKNHNSLKLQQN
jgi:superfamily I DNA/RNA helicase